VIALASSGYDLASVSAPPDMPGVRHDYIDAGGLRMHVALAGPLDVPPVLLVHGWPQNWWCWRKVIPALAGDFRVIAADLRGHGWSEVPGDGYEKERLAGDLLSLLDALRLERVTWIGHDWGGWAGLLAALRAPDRLDRMLALCIPHPWLAPDPRRLAVMLSYQGPIALPLLGPRAANPMLRRILQAGRGRDRLSEKDLALFADRISPEVTVAMYRTFLTHEVMPIVRGRFADAKLGVPTSLLVGSRDLVTQGLTSGPVRGQSQLQVRRLEGVAHWLPEQRPEAVIEWVRQA
jgi:pimeloyl-ACP methyl ester carboxylesterase